jgi:hypothetical protein
MEGMLKRVLWWYNSAGDAETSEGGKWSGETLMSSPEGNTL